MYKLPNARLAITQAVLMAIVSWMFILWLIGIPFLANKCLYFNLYFFVGIGFFAFIIICAIIISIPLVCPKCGKRIAFKNKPPPILFDIDAFKQQFLLEDVRRKWTKCPHCEAEISLEYKDNI